MSSPGSDVLTVEVPARLVVERASVAFIVACALVIEAVAANHPDAPIGLGVVAGSLLYCWRLWRIRNEMRIRRATLDADGRWLVDSTAGQEEAVLLPGSRVLGHSVVLRLKSGPGVCSLWLTGWDLPAVELRQLRVRLLAQGARAGA
jgi:hypothetical protein